MSKKKVFVKFIISIFQFGVKVYIVSPFIVINNYVLVFNLLTSPEDIKALKRLFKPYSALRNTRTELVP